MYLRELSMNSIEARFVDKVGSHSDSDEARDFDEEGGKPENELWESSVAVLSFRCIINL